MSKKKILILLPILIIACFLVYTWAKIASTDSAATWKHYLGLGGFFVLVFLFFRNLDWAIMVTGIFLVVGTFNALAITVDIDTFWMRIGSLTTPPVQLKLFGIFVLYIILNTDSLINIYLDYKEGKSVKPKNDTRENQS